jgi:pimeloyl-ACP methyl ester carboxylesterase
VHYKEAWPETAASADASSDAAGDAAGGSSMQAAAAAAAAAWISPEDPQDVEQMGAAGLAAASAVAEDVAIVLVHGFGGGTFAWRHVLQPLATAVGVRVVAFDRPGFGEFYRYGAHRWLFERNLLD